MHIDLDYFTALANQWRNEADACDAGLPGAESVASEIALKSRAAWARMHAYELEVAIVETRKQEVLDRVILLQTPANN
jgi:hypothetical protein